MITVRLTRPKKYESVGFTRAEMLRIGAKAISLISGRCARARDLFDRPMKPLSPRWAAAKKKLGQPAKRNMMFSGAMLGAMTVVQASDTKCVIGFTRREELAKATRHQNSQAWFGLSPTDETSLAFFADRILRNKLKK